MRCGAGRRSKPSSGASGWPPRTCWRSSASSTARRSSISAGRLNVRNLLDRAPDAASRALGAKEGVFVVPEQDSESSDGTTDTVHVRVYAGPHWSARPTGQVRSVWHLGSGVGDRSLGLACPAAEGETEPPGCTVPVASTGSAALSVQALPDLGPWSVTRVGAPLARASCFPVSVVPFRLGLTLSKPTSVGSSLSHVFWTRGEAWLRRQAIVSP